MTSWLLSNVISGSYNTELCPACEMVLERQNHRLVSLDSPPAPRPPSRWKSEAHRQARLRTRRTAHHCHPLTLCVTLSELLSFSETQVFFLFQNERGGELMGGFPKFKNPRLLSSSISNTGGMTCWAHCSGTTLSKGSQERLRVWAHRLKALLLPSSQDLS